MYWLEPLTDFQEWLSFPFDYRATSWRLYSVSKLYTSVVYGFNKTDWWSILEAIRKLLFFPLFMAFRALIFCNVGSPLRSCQTAAPINGCLIWAVNYCLKVQISMAYLFVHAWLQSRFLEALCREPRLRPLCQSRLLRPRIFKISMNGYLKFWRLGTRLIEW